MRNEYTSDRRITDVSGDVLAGKTIARSSFDASEVFLSFTDGTFVYSHGCDYEGSLDYSAALLMRDARDFGLISDAEYAGWALEWNMAQMRDTRRTGQRAEFVFIMP